MGIETLSNGRSGDEIPTASSGNRVKILISHGGKILPRPGDGQLKYIGGETRVLAVPADIKFSELMKKISSIVEGEMVLKYQVIPDDLEALVSVRSDEDLKYMLDEYERNYSEGNSKIRAFLLPSSLVKLENQTTSTDPNVNEQRYIDAINCIVRPPTVNGTFSRSNSRRSHLSDSNSSSPDARNSDSSSLLEHVLTNACHDGRIDMHRVQSSPSTLYSLNNAVSASNNNVPYHHYYQQQHYHYNQQPQQYATGYQSPRQQLDPRSDRKPPPLTLGQHDFARIGMGQQQQQLPPNHFYQTGRPIAGDSFHEEWLPAPGNGRPDSAPMTPRHMWD